MPARTKRQAEVLEIILSGMEKDGYRPSYREIASKLGLRARSGIARIVADLESQGLLKRVEVDGKFTLEFQEKAAFVSKDLVSIMWLDRTEEDLFLPSFMLGYQSADRIRAFRVTDNAMLPMGIAEDDVALIELRKSVKDGEVVAAFLPDGLGVLRIFFRAGGEVELRASGESPHLTYRVPSNQVKIQGVYRGLLKPVS